MSKPNKKIPIKHPSQQRSVMTFEAIVEAATYLLVKQGLPNVTSNQIADKAGVNINSFYQYFFDKQAVFSLIAERHIADNEKAFALALEAHQSLATDRAFQAVICDMVELFGTVAVFRRQILLAMPLLVGPMRQMEVREGLAKQLMPVIPSIRYHSRAEKKRAAHLLVHTFMATVPVILDPLYADGEKKRLQEELKVMLFRYVGLE